MRAAEHLRQPPADRQAEAGAAVAARRRVVELAEVFEDLRLIVGGDADAGVGAPRSRPSGLRVVMRAAIVTAPSA